MFNQKVEAMKRKAVQNKTRIIYYCRKIPSVLPKFEDMLDEAVTLAEHDINDVDCEIKLDYKVLIPNKVSADPEHEA